MLKNKQSLLEVGEDPFSLPPKSAFSSNRLSPLQMTMIDQSVPSLVRVPPENWMHLFGWKMRSMKIQRSF